MNKLLFLTGLRWIWLVIVVLIIDLGSKYLVFHKFILGSTVKLSPLFNIHYVRNYGAAFSFFANSNKYSWLNCFFITTTIIICTVLLFLMYNTKATQQKLTNIAYALIIGSALGNLSNRLWYGYVIDMIDFHIGSWHFATFNFADFFICISIILIFLEDFLVKK